MAAFLPHFSDLAIGAAPSSAADNEAPLRAQAEYLEQVKAQFLGFPANLHFDHASCGYLLSALTNNAGDPDSEDDAGLHAKPFERAVIAWFTDLAQAEPEHTYGYVTSGGSEGVLFGLHIGRQQLPRAPVYASADAHYCVRKAADLLRMRLVTVACRPDGAMDPDALRTACQAQRRRDTLAGLEPRGAIILATVSTTMRGAYDDVAALRECADGDGIYVHADAALGGLLAPFASNKLSWNFQHGTDSMSISGHKFLGSPVPCGVALVRRHLLPPPSGDEYLGASDHTLGCSRSGLAAVLLWKRLRELGTSGLRQLVDQCQDTAAYAVTALTRAGADPERADGSLTVTFDRPPQPVCRHWRLATQGRRAHLIAMPHVTRHAIDSLSQQWSRS